MSIAAFNQNLLAFLQASPTPFHVVETMSARLKQAGFQLLKESERWNIQPGGRYYVIRNGSSLIAFIHGQQALPQSGIRMIGAHTDSPCLKVKPQPEVRQHGYFQLGVEVYGSVLLNPWYDRDLSLAGRVTFLDNNRVLHSALIDFSTPIAIIPSLAIHLDRDANKNRRVNPQTDILPILTCLEAGEKQNFRALLLQLLLQQVKKQISHCEPESILDYELSFYDVQPPSLLGLKQEFIAGARLDNLLSCYVGLQSLLAIAEQRDKQADEQAGEQAADSQQSCLLVCNDHEEVGSASACGAQGPMLKAFLQRIVPDVEAYSRMVDGSMMISADNAHGIHPNYSSKHDSGHGPVLNGGPVIKVNANQRYATNSETAAVFRHLCEQADVPVQMFVSRADMACGSTIGPITATEIGVKTLDVGLPTFAMHSIRELGGAKDAFSLCGVLQGFYQFPSSLTAASD